MQLTVKERRHQNVIAQMVCGLALLMVWRLGGSSAFSFNWTKSQSLTLKERPEVSLVAASQRAVDSSHFEGTSFVSNLCGCLSTFVAVACVTSLTVRAKAQRSASKAPVDAGEDVEMGRRAMVLPMALATCGTVAAQTPAYAEEVALPTKITADPYELLSIDPASKSQDKKEFDMHKNYRQDTYQVVKHMKISGSIDKGAPNMEKWNKRVKEEMNDWVALYRRQDAVVGRQSYYALYSAVNTLASHFTSYGPKFPFPNKRRARFYELINQTERYLEKNK